MALDLLQVVFSSIPACGFGTFFSHAESSANSVGERAGTTQYVGFEVIMAVYNVYCFLLRGGR